MARSALSGFVVGAVVAVSAAGVASVMTSPDLPSPEASAVNLPAGSGFDGVREDVSTRLPALEPVETLPETPRADVPQPETAPSLDSADLQPAEQPVAASATGTGAEISAPADPGESALPAPSTEEAAPQLGAAPTPPSASSQADAPVENLPARPVPPQTGESPEMAALAPMSPVADPLPESSSGDSTPTRDAPVPSTSASGEPAPTADREPAELIPLPRSETPARPTLPSVNTPAAEGPQIGEPVRPLTERDKPAPTEAAAPAPQASADLPPLQAYAAPFENPEGKPLMSIVLIDRGDSKIGLEALASFPYPLSFAVDVTSPMAKRRMQDYRAAGFEVLALSDIPLGATAGDTEMLLRAALRELPEAVAVMEGDQTGLQSEKVISDTASAVVGETGHGLVFFSKGLNTAQKLASKNGVAATSVFRDFDDKGQTAVVIRRFLDQAAFKARQQEGGVVMLGRLQPETISALLLWGLQDRASRVALAPISAVLQAGAN